MAAVYGSAGFQYLAQLIYLKRDLSKQVFLCRDPYICDWQTYNTQTHQLFAQVIQGTYQDSLDCHLLSGRRDIEDVLASHRSIGRFDHRYWMIGMVNGEPIGVILLSFLPEQDSCEVVYIGVLPTWRRQGYGSALLGLAFEIVRETGTSALTLTVDANNTPAQKLYRNFGFRELTRRDVWIKFV
jgi:ribosomal protein S18 acetylase RimI-like enzyme